HQRRLAALRARHALHLLDGDIHAGWNLPARVSEDDADACLAEILQGNDTYLDAGKAFLDDLHLGDAGYVARDVVHADEPAAIGRQDVFRAATLHALERQDAERHR